MNRIVINPIGCNELFFTGKIMATQRAKSILDDITGCLELARLEYNHAALAFEGQPEGLHQQNLYNLKHGGLIVSKLITKKVGRVFWIVTEGGGTDRQTTFVTPEDYQNPTA